MDMGCSCYFFSLMITQMSFMVGSEVAPDQSRDSARLSLLSEVCCFFCHILLVLVSRLRWKL